MGSGDEDMLPCVTRCRLGWSRRSWAGGAWGRLGATVAVASVRRATELSANGASGANFRLLIALWVCVVLFVFLCWCLWFVGANFLIRVPTWTWVVKRVRFIRVAKKGTS